MRLESYPLNIKATAGNGTSQLVRDLREKYVQIGGGAFTGSLQVEVSLNGGTDYFASGAAITAPIVFSIPEPATHIRIVTGSLSLGAPTACVNGYNTRTEG
jgi:hypothetical protein